MRARIGTIPTMITTGKAGSCTKATGIMRITTETTDVTTIIAIISQDCTSHLLPRAVTTRFRSLRSAPGEGFLRGFYLLRQLRVSGSTVICGGIGTNKPSEQHRCCEGPKQLGQHERRHVRWANTSERVACGASKRDRGIRERG